LSLLFRILRWVPEVQRLQSERDTLRSEQSSVKLKLRAASAEMGVLEEQLRVLQGERDRLVQEVARQKAEHGSLKARLEASAADGAGEVLIGKPGSPAQDEAARSVRERSVAGVRGVGRVRPSPGQDLTGPLNRHM